MRAWQLRPALVYGARRSGTTLLQSLLDGVQSSLNVPGELKLKFLTRFNDKDRRTQFRTYMQQARTLWSGHRIKVASEEGQLSLRRAPGIPFTIGTLTPAQTTDRVSIDTYLHGLELLVADPPPHLSDDLVADVTAFAEALICKHDYVGWASTEVGGRPEILIPQFKQMFRGARFVFIERDPWFILRSKIVKRRNTGRPLGPRAIRAEWRKVRTVLRYIRRAGSGPASDAVLVKYEELVHRPKSVMARVLLFLRATWDDVYAVPTTLRAPSRALTSSRNTDRVFNSSTRNWTAALQVWERKALEACALVWPVRRA